MLGELYTYFPAPLKKLYALVIQFSILNNICWEELFVKTP